MYKTIGAFNWSENRENGKRWTGNERDFGWDGCLVGVITLIIIVKKVKLMELVFVTSFMKMSNNKLLDASSSELYTNKRQRIYIHL